MLRNDALINTSPYEMAAFFHRFKPTGRRMGTAKYLRFDRARPLYLTYGHYPNTSVKIPQFYCSWPSEPTELSSDEDKLKYAGFILGLFASYTNADFQPGGYFRASETGTLHDIYLKCMEGSHRQKYGTATVLLEQFQKTSICKGQVSSIF